MSHRPKLSLPAAILININVMVGSGIFINTVLLAKNAGGLSPLAYASVGLLLLPLIISISKLARHHHGGNFYTYGSNIHPSVGLLTSWCYFVAKLASCALGIHVGISLLQTIYRPIAHLPTLALDCGIIALFAFLNTRNLQMGKQIQVMFMTCKLLPIGFAIISGLYLFDPSNFSFEHLYPSGIINSVPFILYAFSGFEVSCSLSRSLDNPEKNGPRAILYAYGIGIALVCLFQLLFYAALGSTLENLPSYLNAFPSLLNAFSTLSDATRMTIIGFLHAGIALSSLGAAYGVMYSNSWNLFELANNDYVPYKSLFTKLNVHHIPIACIITEALTVITYLLITQGKQVPLQQISAFGMAITYSLSAVSLAFLVRRLTGKVTLSALLGIGSCVILLAAAMRNFVLYGCLPGIIFIGIIAVSMTIFITHKRKTPVVSELA